MRNFSDVLLTVDFDRTLTAPDSTIPERNLEAIRAFMARGGALSQLHPLELEQAATVRTLMAEFPDLLVEVQGVAKHYRFCPSPAWDALYEANHAAHAAARPEDDLGPFLKFSLYGEIREPNVAHLFSGSAAEICRMDAAERRLRELFGSRVQVSRSAARIIDVSAAGVSKIRAARSLQAALGRKLLVCVGDAENDLPMLRGADYAFCPADGALASRFPNVCRCADGAVAEVIYEKIPEILGNCPFVNDVRPKKRKEFVH
ncbi:MAG: HAD hydrolase family protein [Firmicutes bacterium]|nr:HAD hydrolase family protein [Bacillota bacterium]